MSLAYEMYYDSAVDRMVRDGRSVEDAKFLAHTEAHRLTSQFKLRNRNPDTKYEGSWAHNMETK